MNYYPLFRVRSWNYCMRCMFLYIPMNFRYGQIALRAIRSCPGGLCPESSNLSLTCSITTMLGTLLMIYTKHICFHEYISVEVCLVGVFPHSVSTWRDPCVRVCEFLTLASPLTRRQSRTLDPSEGTFELTDGSACIIGGNTVCWIFQFPLILHSLWGVS